jgi:RNA polymerase sigma-70 factor (ECF subfamily)
MAVDAALLRESRKRPEAFVEVCRRHAGELSAWLRRRVGADVADDLLAETFARAWYARRKFRDPGTGSAGPWLQGIAANVVRDYRRRGAIEARASRRLGLARTAAEEHGYAATVSRLDAHTRLDDFRDRLDELPAEQRAALELRVIDELDYDEIAERLDVSPTTARTRVHRALKTLRPTADRSEP